MKKVILLPSSGPDDWKRFLAEPSKQWRPGYSAKTLAYSWESADGFPPEVKQALAQVPAFATLDPLIVCPEWKVPLPGGSRSSQTDAWVLARTAESLVSIAVEGKVSEPFGPTLDEWLAGASDGKLKRLYYLLDVLGLHERPPGTIRYQLLHRAASAVIEAERFHAAHAVLLIHSFSQDNLWFDDFAAFAALYGRQVHPGQLSTASARGALPLHMTWVRGDKHFLDC